MFLAQENLYEEGKSFVGSDLRAENFVGLGCSQSHSFSRGSTRVSSSDIDDKPIIDSQFFSHTADLKNLARHIQGLANVQQNEELLPSFKPDGKRNHPDSFHIYNLEGATSYIVDPAINPYHTFANAVMLPKEKTCVMDERS